MAVRGRQSVGPAHGHAHGREARYPPDELPLVPLKKSCYDAAEVAKLEARTMSNDVAAVTLEPAALQALSDLMDGDVVAWDDLLDTHLQASARLAADIRQSCAQRDWEVLERSAHTLKSSSALFGARDLSSACARLEHAARVGDVDALPELTKAALAVYVATEQALQSWIGRVPSTS